MSSMLRAVRNGVADTVTAGAAVVVAGSETLVAGVRGLKDLTTEAMPRIVRITVNNLDTEVFRSEVEKDLTLQGLLDTKSFPEVSKKDYDEAVKRARKNLNIQ